ncbi:hypothetical protein BO86DRAFT_399560 [Aspergillus japonicus CBS 114.51]|uniref:Uncharacterized protein n=1 Tax=Aspergillus japonicus CBS 114.51 TaxID=1448312 RepID=A0A8T8X0Y6_ASPJA|nr:hypothetical protein BO86DRAFT_399560 [Aspergillus japonicus CBS 114.51]RAH81725.1 hypothetical protein BO86DRAFT_399560 [Aspergillus japonicus CBS 114.51]
MRPNDLLWLFFVFSATVSQATAAGLHDALTAVNIANLLFTLCQLLCGPRHLLHGRMVGAALADAPLRCAAVDLLHIPWPTAAQNHSTASCGTYLAPYIQRAGGRVLRPNTTAAAGENCIFCPVTDMNTMLAQLGIEVGMRWRDLGPFAVYLIMNIAGIFGLYWLTRGRRAS